MVILTFRWMGVGILYPFRIIPLKTLADKPEKQITTEVILQLIKSISSSFQTKAFQTRAFAIIGPSLWNQLLPSTRSTLLTGEPSASFRSLKTALLSGSLALEALLIGVHCKRRYINVKILSNTIQYNLRFFSILGANVFF